MKIKRFFAADIRQAMRMVKEELGADAVIMSNRAVEGGIEIVAARDFDEQTIQNKLQEQAIEKPTENKIKKVTFPTFDEAKKRFQVLESQKKPEPTQAAQEQEIPQNVASKPQEPVPVKSVGSIGKRMVLPNFEAARKRQQLENERRNAAALIAAKAEREKRFATETDTTNASSNNGRGTSPFVGYAEKLQLGKKPEPTPSVVATTAKRDTFSTLASKNQQANLSDSLLLEMSKELKYLRSAMDTKFANISWANNPQASSLRNSLLQRLTGMGIAKKLANTLADQLAEENDLELAFIKAQGMLSQALPVAADNLLETGGIVALVGPTGVGKTTTIAKLAAKFILKHGSSQVALITTDNYRIGAHEQLNTYGRILNVPVRVASCADDLNNIINSFANKRLILIDTAGMCQRDMKLVEQINTLQQNDLPIRTYLVMSAATEFRTMDSIIKAFSVFEPQAAILTKLDESIMVGSAISSIIEHNLPLSFITDGQQVPENFHAPDAQSLIRQCVVEADADFDDDTDYQPWGAQAYA